MLVVSLPANFVKYSIFIKSTFSFKISNDWQAPLSAFLRGSSVTGETPTGEAEEAQRTPLRSASILTFQSPPYSITTKFAKTAFKKNT
ncbi:hypothetical protein CUU66_02555 [Peribacillus deserti]|uniref:Uncharacterized protein n=1 Tax=Peribacillus deserti TaxID=673318 RepID=A0A2N5MAV1_9BACI|nr:hypothetical protein CUU66_02555 [Peribacillus deserti]